jgi:hypothetical protein
MPTAGQTAGGIREGLPAAEIIERMIAEAERAHSPVTRGGEQIALPRTEYTRHVVVATAWKRTVTSVGWRGQPDRLRAEAIA